MAAEATTTTTTTTTSVSSDPAVDTARLPTEAEIYADIKKEFIAEARKREKADEDKLNQLLILLAYNSTLFDPLRSPLTEIAQDGDEATLKYLLGASRNEPRFHLVDLAAEAIYFGLELGNHLFTYLHLVNEKLLHNKERGEHIWQIDIYRFSIYSYAATGNLEKFIAELQKNENDTSKIISMISAVFERAAQYHHIEILAEMMRQCGSDPALSDILRARIKEIVRGAAIGNQLGLLLHVLAYFAEDNTRFPDFKSVKDIASIEVFQVAVGELIAQLPRLKNLLVAMFSKASDLKVMRFSEAIEYAIAGAILGGNQHLTSCLLGLYRTLQQRFRLPSLEQTGAFCWDRVDVTNKLSTPGMPSVVSGLLSKHFDRHEWSGWHPYSIPENQITALSAGIADDKQREAAASHLGFSKHGFFTRLKHNKIYKLIALGADPKTAERYLALDKGVRNFMLLYSAVVVRSGLPLEIIAMLCRQVGYKLEEINTISNLANRRLQYRMVENINQDPSKNQEEKDAAIRNANLRYTYRINGIFSPPSVTRATQTPVAAQAARFHR